MMATTTVWPSMAQAPWQAYPHAGFRPLLPLSTGLWGELRWAEFELGTFKDLVRTDMSNDFDHFAK